MTGEGKWFFGYLGTWFVLAAMAESPSLRPLAAALAVSVALTATFIVGPKAAENVTLGKV